MTFKNPEFSANAPYYDDFQDTKNFLKILFKPGYAVQARELTQLQSILQSQVATFADHIFQNGSQVFGGNVQVTTSSYVRVEKNLFNLNGSASSIKTNDYFNTLPSNLLKVYRREGSSTTYTELATIRVIFTEPSNYSINDEYGILFYNVVSSVENIEELIDGDSFEMEQGYFIGIIEGQSPTLLRVIQPTTSEIPDQENSNLTLIQSAIEPYGVGTLVTVDEGIFYIDGYFVKSERQTVSLYKNSVQGETEKSLEDGTLYNFGLEGIRLFNAPSHRVGYEVVREIVTAEDDETLKDPARGFYNYNAPGADRYKISLVLKTVEYDVLSVDIENYVNDDFIQILRTTRGVVDYIKNKSSYSQILDLFASRTYDESGSYTVKPFLADVKNHLRKDKFIFTVSPANLQSSTNPIWDNDGTEKLDILLKIGSYVWQKNSEADLNLNPFTLASLETFGKAVGKITSVQPNYDPVAGTRSFKFTVELLNSKKFPAINSQTTPITFVVKPSSLDRSFETTIIDLQSEIDPKGAYSILDLPKGDPNKLAITLQPGKAYIYGYEFETFAPRTIEYINEGNETTLKNVKGLNVNYDLGNYIYGTFTAKNANQPTVVYEELPKFELVDKNVNTLLIYPSPTQIASARVLSWSGFKSNKEFEKLNDKERTDMVDIQKLYNLEEFDNNYPHESVLFVELE